jgi:hypothetical protein
MIHVPLVFSLPILKSVIFPRCPGCSEWNMAFRSQDLVGKCAIAIGTLLLPSLLVDRGTYMHIYVHLSLCPFLYVENLVHTSNSNSNPTPQGVF